MSSEKIKPCPCVNENHYEQDEIIEQDGESCFQVACLNCGRKGPIAGTADEATSEWNRRPSPWRPISEQSVRELIKSAHEVVRISDRSHVAWDNLKADITRLEQELSPLPEPPKEGGGE